jgi:hypothetical protein
MLIDIASITQSALFSRKSIVQLLLTAVLCAPGCSEAQSTAFNPLAPAAPTDVIATVDYVSITLRWPEVAQAISYNVYWSTEQSFTVDTGNEVVDVPRDWLQSDLLPGTSYYYYVTAVGIGGESEPSDVVTAMTDNYLPSPSVQASNTNTSVTLTWPSTGADSYNVYWSLTPGVTTSNGTRVLNVTSPWTQINLTPLTTYYYILTDVKDGIESSPTEEIPVTLITYVTVCFSVDDTANKVYAGGDLQWKGQFNYSSANGTITYNAGWSGPYPALYDDGPVSLGGHEPEGSAAGDHILGCVAKVRHPVTGSQVYGYGLIDTSAPYSGGWVWVGSNGSFTIEESSTSPVIAQGMTFDAFGTTDLQVMLDANNLDTSHTWSTSTVTIKGTFDSWSEVALTNDGSGHYIFTLSDIVGTGKMYPHSGLAYSGDIVQFVFVLGGIQYKSFGGACLMTGVSAQTKPSAGGWSTVTVQADPINYNTEVTVT